MLGLGLFSGGIATMGGAAPVSFIPITEGTNTSVADLGSGLYRVTKTGGGGAYNADFTSEALTGDFTMRIDWVSGSNDIVVGISLDATVDAGIAGIKYGLDYWSGGDTMYVVVNGSSGGQPSVSPGALKRAWINRTDDSISLRYGGASYAAATLFSGYPLINALGTVYLDGSLYDDGSIIDVRIDTP